jgi:chemotaxis signal transduction protein
MPKPMPKPTPNQSPVPGTQHAGSPVLPPGAARSQRELQLCSFWIAERLFGVDILDVKEINREVGLTPVHHAPPDVRGYVNIRGQIHLVLDLRVMLGFGSAPAGPASRVVLFKPSIGDSFGVLVERAGDIVQIATERIEWRDRQPAGHAHDPRKAIIAGDCKFPTKLLTLLHSRGLLEAVQVPQ